MPDPIVAPLSQQPAVLGGQDFSGVPPSSMGGGRVFTEADVENIRQQEKAKLYTAISRNQQETQAALADKLVLEQQLRQVQLQAQQAPQVGDAAGGQKAVLQRLETQLQSLSNQMIESQQALVRQQQQQRIETYRRQRASENPDIDPVFLNGQNELEIDAAVANARVWRENVRRQALMEAQQRQTIPQPPNPSQQMWPQGMPQPAPMGYQQGYPQGYPQAPVQPQTMGLGVSSLVGPQNMRFHPNQNYTINGAPTPPAPTAAPNQAAYGMPPQFVGQQVPQQGVPQMFAGYPGYPQQVVQGVPTPYAGGVMPGEQVLTQQQVLEMPLQEWGKIRQNVTAQVNQNPFVVS